jgi:DNA topoisomerase-1
MATEEAAVPPAVAEAVEHAKSAGLRYVNVTHLERGIRRVGSGKGFRYLSPDGKTIKDPAEVARLKKLAIPPAWTDVWISPSPLGHIQAVGRDARGRRQYRYHPDWRTVRDETKYGQLAAFGKVLPAIRRRVQRDLRRKGLPREKVFATVVELLERTMMRVGNEEYARTNQSFGLTTLRGRHVKLAGATLKFQFRGKSGKTHALTVVDRRLAKIVKACQDIPGQELFQFVDETGAPVSVDSADINAYLREISGTELTAKVFRTWAGTVRALAALRAVPADGATKAALVEVVKEVAQQLGNTPAVCRKSYIHPGLIESYERGEFHALVARIAGRAKASRGLSADERLLLAFLAALKRRKAPTLEQALKRSLAKARKAG